MMSKSPAESASDRLERLEREDRKKRWDSVLEAHVSRSTLSESHEPAAERVKAPRNHEAGPSDPISIITLLADRLERVERLAVRLESEVRQQERQARVGSQRMAVGVAFAVIVAAIGLLGGLVRR